MVTIRMVLIAAVLLTFAEVVPRANAQDVVELVTSLLADEDKEVRALAFDQIRKEAKGEESTLKFAALLPKFPAETQIGLLSALADRGDTAAAPAVRELLSKTSDESVRSAAIKALGALGGTSDLNLFIQLLSQGSEPVRKAARASLVALPTDATNTMVATLKDSPAATRVALIEVLTARRAHDAVAAILEIAAADDASVRQAAVSALIELADAKDVPQMITLMLKAPSALEREAAERAIATVCQRNPDKQVQAEPVLEAMKKLKDSEREILFSTLGRIGGPSVLKVVDDSLQSSRPQLREAAIRALSNWPDGSVVSRLLQVARTDERADERTLALKALIRIAPLADERDDRRRLDTVRTVFVMCGSDAERRLVLDRAKAIRNIGTLRFVVPFLDQPSLAQQACQTVVELAHHSSLRESNRDEFHRVLDQVIRISKDATVIDRAKRYKAGQTWKQPDPAR